MSDRLAQAIARGGLVLDAAMGTRLIAIGLQPSNDDPALWCLDRPEAVLEIHARDVAAGADALLSNTFGANRAWLARFGRAGDVDRLNRAAVALARQTAGRSRFVLGSIGPTAADDPESYVEQAAILADAGVDALVFETHRLDQAEVALRTVGPSFGLPRLVSLLQWPADLGTAVHRLEDHGASALGANCQSGMERALPLARDLRRVTGLPLIVKPAAGLPGAVLERPESFAAAATTLLALRPVLVGGCCGTTEAHVAALRNGWYDAAPGSPAG